MESITRLRWNRRKREVPRASSFPSKRSNRTWTWTTRFSPCLRRNRKQRNPRLENNLLHREFPTICLNKRMPFRYQIAEDNDMNKSIRCLVAVMVLVAGAPLFADRALAQEAKVDSDTISGLGARNIGSAAMSGRVAAIAAVKENGRLTVYVGAASGGVWKSTNGGTTFKPVFDKEPVESIGAITVDPQSPKTIWVVTGKTWNKILKGPNPSTGCSMISMNSGDPKVLFAGMWDFRRKGWTFRSGGESPTSRSGSGFFKTTDGGRTWQELDEQSGKGLPAKPWGRIAVAIAPSKPDVVYAMIETTRSALFRSDDGGKTWHEGDRSNWMVWRPFYFANLIVDPKNENKIYKPDLTLIMSEDGGKSFSGVGNAAHGDRSEERRVG